MFHTNHYCLPEIQHGVFSLLNCILRPVLSAGFKVGNLQLHLVCLQWSCRADVSRNGLELGSGTRFPQLAEMLFAFCAQDLIHQQEEWFIQLFFFSFPPFIFGYRDHLLYTLKRYVIALQLVSVNSFIKGKPQHYFYSAYRVTGYCSVPSRKLGRHLASSGAGDSANRLL